MKKIQLPNLTKLINDRKKASRGNNSPLHDFIFKARKELGETAIKGPGSFGFYLGLLKAVPDSVRYRVLAEVKETKPKVGTEPGELFTWKIKQWKKEQIKV